MNAQKNALLLLFGFALVAGAAFAQPVSERLQNPQSANVEVVAHVVEPEPLDPTPERLAGLQMPEGFEIGVFAEGLINPRMMAVASGGTVYVTRRSVGDVVRLSDTDGDGRADEEEVVASRPGMHGIAIDGRTMYLVTVEDIYRTEIQPDGALAPLERIVDDLPAGGQHPNRMVVVGPDGMLYVTVGSTCNACGETDPENATMLRVAPDGQSRTIYASGLRNTIGYGFVPETGDLYGMDHGIDWLGDNEQHEELNRIVQGAKYGWPFVYADGKFNPADQPPGEITLEEWAEESTEPVGLYTPHAAPMQMAFYTGEAFPEGYRGDAFIAMRGSWNRRPPSGYEVVRIRFEEGRPAGFEPFVKGFLVEEGGGWGHLGRLAGLAQAPDGALLVSDDKNGVIYRIAYTGGADADTSSADTSSASGGPDAPTNEAAADARVLDTPDAEPPASTPEQLAAEIVRAEGDTTEAASLQVTTPAFENGAAIPETFAAEGENISPALEWSEGPAGTQSYAIVMEDPDVSEKPPFVHWMMYNIPADVTRLDEAVPGGPWVPKPEGALQGTNDRGSVGYFGPRPPKGDPAHGYHIQVFALDAMPDLPHGASRAAFLDAIRGHVLASGEVTGTYQR